jgi:hypothetical protein
MSLLDKIITVGYTSGFVDNLKDKELFVNASDEWMIQNAEDNIEKMGVCEFDGKQVSMYAYYDLKTILGLNFRDYVITCEYLSITTHLGFYGEKESVVTLND